MYYFIWLLYFPILENADMYILESNYDVELLWSSSRPFHTKKRIDGDYGHMSNVASAVLLSKLIGKNTKKVVFARSKRCVTKNLNTTLSSGSIV